MVGFNRAFSTYGLLNVIKFRNACLCLNLKKCRPSVLVKHKQLNNMLAAYFCKICIWLAGGQPDATFNWLVAGRMQTIDKFGYFVLHDR
jgi:hypothetical protein